MSNRKTVVRQYAIARALIEIAKRVTQPAGTNLSAMVRSGDEYSWPRVHPDGVDEWQRELMSLLGAVSEDIHRLLIFLDPEYAAKHAKALKADRYWQEACGVKADYYLDLFTRDSVYSNRGAQPKEIRDAAKEVKDDAVDRQG